MGELEGRGFKRKSFIRGEMVRKMNSGAKRMPPLQAQVAYEPEPPQESQRSRLLPGEQCFCQDKAQQEFSVGMLRGRSLFATERAVEPIDRKTTDGGGGGVGEMRGPVSVQVVLWKKSVFLPGAKHVCVKGP